MYPVKVSTPDGKISRVYDVVVVKYNGPLVYKENDPLHRDITPDQLISVDSLKDLTDNGYTVTWAKAPASYEMPGFQAVELQLTDKDGRTFTTTDDINVKQRINVHFVDQDKNELAVVPVYGSVGYDSANAGQQLKVQAGQLDLSKAYKQLLAKYNIDADSYAAAMKQSFIKQAADQDVTILVNKKQGSQVINYVYQDPQAGSKVVASKTISKDFDDVISPSELISDIPVGYYFDKNNNHLINVTVDQKKCQQLQLMLVSLSKNM